MSQLTRRSVLLHGAGACLAVAACQQTSIEAAEPNLEPWTERAGLQLWTFRDEMLADMGAVFGRVGAMGYSEGEFVEAFFVKSPSEIKSLADSAGLSLLGCHVSMETCEDPEAFAKFSEKAKEIDCEYIVVPWLHPSQRKTADDYRRVADSLNAAAERARQVGLTFAYHNHDFEFITLDNELPYDILLARTDPGLVDMELDLCWIEYAGRSAAEYIRAHPGRFLYFHVKDFTEGRRQCPVGQGVIDFPAIFAEVETAGLRHAFVEQDGPENADATAGESFAYLSRIGFEIPKLR